MRIEPFYTVWVATVLTLDMFVPTFAGTMPIGREGAVATWPLLLAYLSPIFRVISAALEFFTPQLVYASMLMRAAGWL